MKILIAVPCMDMMHTGFVRSFLNIKKPLDAVVSSAFLQATLIYESRNVIAQNAINEGFDRVLWLDSDMIIPPDALMKLSQHLDNGYDMVSGLYFGRKYPCNPIILDKADWECLPDGNVTVDSTSYVDYPKDNFFEIAGCGFGCVMTTVDLLREMVDKYGAPFTPLMGMGEDVAFCWRVRKAGHTIYCDSRIKCGHIGQVVFDEQIYTNANDAIKQKGAKQ